MPDDDRGRTLRGAKGRIVRATRDGTIGGLLVTGLAWLIAGPALVLFLAPLALATLIVPVILNRPSRSRLRGTEMTVRFGSYGLASVIVLLVATLLHDLPLSPARWLDATALLLAWSLFLVGVTTLFARRDGVATTALLIPLAFAWLSWPIWTADFHELASRLAELAWLHPPLAMNGAVRPLGVWTEQPVLYQLTRLGQDIPYELPASAWRASIVYAAVGCVCLAVRTLLERRAHG